MKSRSLLALFFTLWTLTVSMNVAASTVRSEGLAELKISSSETVPLPPGSWSLQWKSDFNFCRPERRTECRDTLGRVLILTNDADNDSPFHAIIVRHSSRGNRNFSTQNCYSKNGQALFDSHQTSENQLLNKCSFGKFNFGTGIFQASHWWWAEISEGTKKIPSLNIPNVHMEISLFSSGLRGYIFDVFLKQNNAGTALTVDQINAWKKRYVDALTAGLLNNKPLPDRDSLAVLFTPPKPQPSVLDTYFTQTQRQYDKLQGAAAPVLQDEGLSIPEFFSESQWSSPVSLEGQQVFTPLGSLSKDSTDFIVDDLLPITAPSAGQLVYRGTFEDDQSGFVISHGQGVFSIISSKMPWNIAYAPEIGQTLDRDQYLTSASVAFGDQHSTFTWSLVHSPKTIIENDSIKGSDLETLQSAPTINTRVVARMGSVLIQSQGDVPPNSKFVINNAPLSLNQGNGTAMLLPLEPQTLTLITGGLFKKTSTVRFTPSSNHALIQTLRRDSGGDWSFSERVDRSTNLGSSKAVFAQLLNPTVVPSAAMAAVLPPAAVVPVTPPAAPPRAPQVLAAAPAPAPKVPSAEALRIKALEAELEMVKSLQTLAAKAAPAPIPEPVTTAPTQRSKRHALVIGNAKYAQVPVLDNSVNDDRAIATNLKNIGFEVAAHYDVTQRSFNRAVREFTQQLKGGEEVVFYFAGHGVQLGSSNFLLPVDVGSDSPSQVRDESIDLQNILESFSEGRAKFTLAMVDACRDNPFKGNGRSIGGRGLAPTSAATGQMILFSAGAGQQALDKLGPTDKDRHGVFTRVLLKEMQTPGLPVDGMLRKVRQEVVRLAKSVGHEQVPALYDQTVGEFYLNPK